MIEIPRAALTADQIADYAEFISFGTNDLTQTTYGISRDDAEAGFLIEYIGNGIFPTIPFATIDRDGVGQLMQLPLPRDGLKIRISNAASAENTAETRNLFCCAMNWV